MAQVNPDFLKQTFQSIHQLVEETQESGATFEPEAMPTLFGAIGHYATLPECAQYEGHLPAGAMNAWRVGLRPGQVITSAGIIEWIRRFFPDPVVVQIVRPFGGRAPGGGFGGSFGNEGSFSGGALV
jgi:hypothetical protein